MYIFVKKKDPRRNRFAHKYILFRSLQSFHIDSVLYFSCVLQSHNVIEIRRKKKFFYILNKYGIAYQNENNHKVRKRDQKHTYIHTLYREI